jgi:hypothetical protein
VTGAIVDAGVEVKFLVRDRDTKYVAGFDEVFRLVFALGSSPSMVRSSRRGAPVDQA